MKKAIVLFSIIILACCSPSCNDDETALTIEEQQLNNLARTWRIGQSGSVTLNGNEAPGDWSNFNITFTRQLGVSVQGDPTDVVDIFSISTYNFDGGSETSFTVIFNGDPNERANINNNNMTMSFTLEEGDVLGSKVSSVHGDWIFSLETVR